MRGGIPSAQVHKYVGMKYNAMSLETKKVFSSLQRFISQAYQWR